MEVNKGVFEEISSCAIDWHRCGVLKIKFSEKVFRENIAKSFFWKSSNKSPCKKILYILLKSGKSDIFAKKRSTMKKTFKEFQKYHFFLHFDKVRKNTNKSPCKKIHPNSCLWGLDSYTSCPLPTGQSQS